PSAGQAWHNAYKTPVVFVGCVTTGSIAERTASQESPIWVRSNCVQGCSEFVGVQLHLQDVSPEHDHPTGVPFFTGSGEVKQKPAPYPKIAVLVAFEPDAPKEHGVVQQQHIHGFAVPVRRLQHEVFDGFGLPPIPCCKARSEKPEKRSESQGAGGPVDGDEVNGPLSRRTARLPHCAAAGNRCGLLSGAGSRRSQSIFRK